MKYRTDKERREARRAQLKAWREANKDKAAQSRKAYLARQGITESELNAAYCRANRERILARQAAYYRANRERVLGRNERWRADNHAKVLEARRARRQMIKDGTCVPNGFRRARRYMVIAPGHCATVTATNAASARAECARSWRVPYKTVHAIRNGRAAGD